MSFQPIALHLFRRRTLVALGIATAAVCGTGGTWAQSTGVTVPQRPVKIVVPFSPGGAADTYARLVGQRLTEVWGNQQTVVIDNRAGAGGVIGTEAAARSQPDGSTLLMVTIGHAVNPFMYTKLPYNTQEDFVPVGVVATVPSLVVTGPALKGKSLSDILAMAKQKPGTLQYASSGLGSTSHVSAALMESMTGIDMLHVPYRGAAPALQDVMADRVSLSVDVITSSLPLVQGGRLQALAITSKQRSAQLPDVPTVAEAGIPGYEFGAWYMLLAPAKTPQPVLEQLNAALIRVAADPEFKQKVEGAGGEVQAMTLEQSKVFLNTEFERWAKVVRERNIKAD